MLNLPKLVILVIGASLLLVGVTAALLGPVEMYCFYLFSEGGRFHYEGFGFGSFMFGNIASQIIGYYVIGILLIPLGYGHLRMQRWARILSLTLFWCWLVVGLPLVVVFLFILVSTKELSVLMVLMVTVVLGMSYLFLPWMLIRFYQSVRVKQLFEDRDPNISWIERIPVPVLVVGALCLFYAVLLHILILFNGLVPCFGAWLSGFEGILALDLLLASLVWLTVGVLRRKLWAWWGCVVYFGALGVSAMVTLVQSSYAELLSLMRFPPTEIEILQRLPFQGVHLAAFIGPTLLLTWGAILLSKRHFGSGGSVVRRGLV